MKDKFVFSSVACQYRLLTAPSISPLHYRSAHALDQI